MSTTTYHHKAISDTHFLLVALDTVQYTGRCEFNTFVSWADNYSNSKLNYTAEVRET